MVFDPTKHGTILAVGERTVNRQVVTFFRSWPSPPAGFSAAAAQNTENRVRQLGCRNPHVSHGESQPKHRAPQVLCQSTTYMEPQSAVRSDYVRLLPHVRILTCGFGSFLAPCRVSGCAPGEARLLIMSAFLRITEESLAYNTPRTAEASPSALQQGRVGEMGPPVLSIPRTWQCISETNTPGCG